MPTAPINGIELFYEDSDAENADGKPVLFFLHGAAGNHMSWWQQVPTFRQSYRCIAIDHRGFGRSLDTTGEGTAKFIDDLEALVDHLGVPQLSLVAQSMGGRASLGYAVRHPERVKALVMADTWGFFDWPEQQERAHHPRGEFAERCIGIGVGGAGNRKDRREFRIAKAGEGADETGDARDGERGLHQRGPTPHLAGGPGEQEGDPQAEGGRVALLVDELLGQQQVVVKNLEANYRKVDDVSGATIMGDGRVALILDIGSLVRRSRG